MHFYSATLDQVRFLIKCLKHYQHLIEQHYNQLRENMVAKPYGCSSVEWSIGCKRLKKVCRMWSVPDIVFLDHRFSCAQLLHGLQEHGLIIPNAQSCMQGWCCYHSKNWFLKNICLCSVSATSSGKAGHSNLSLLTFESFVEWTRNQNTKPF